MIALLARRLTFAFVVGLAALMVAAPAGRTLTSERGSIANEESPEDRGEETFEAASLVRETRPQIQRKRSRPSVVVHARPATTQPFASVAAPLHPSQFSVRRLL